jgi:Tfp pilus assembly protein PilO
MNNSINNLGKVNLDMENIRVLYKHYKGFLLPIGVILASILVIIYIIFPQIQQYFSSQGLVSVEQQKLSTLKNNYNLLVSLDDAQIASNLKTLSSALPAQKDFAGIIDAISYVSAKTGVSVGNFEFSLGNLSASNFAGTAYPSTKIDISLKGDAKNIANFVSEIVKTMPIAEVTAVNMSGSTGTITVLFYYKPFPSQNVSDQAPIVPLSAKQLSLIKDVSLWNFAGSGNFPLTPVIPATSSAQTAGSPF